MTNFSPREIVSELDRYIVGQTDAKRAVAIALRNRWRRQQLTGDLREEVLPKNILMIGPTGVGKTEISRRLAKLAGAPFIKIEATKFTEVGYVGRDVDSIIRDLVEIGINLVREAKRREVKARAEKAAEERVLDALVGEGAQAATRESFRRRLRNNELGDKEIEIKVSDSKGGGMPMFELPGQPGSSVGMINIGEMLGKALGGGSAKPRRVTVKDSYAVLIAEESDKLLDSDQITTEALRSVEDNGIVFLDEIDKICSRSDAGRAGADVSREGVQRSVAAYRGHNGIDQARAGENRPHPVHCLWRLPRFEAVRPASRVAGPSADPRRTKAARQGRSAAHSNRTRGQPDQAVRSADADRGRDAAIYRRRDRRVCRHRRTSELDRREHRRAAVANRDRAGAR